MDATFGLIIVDHNLGLPPFIHLESPDAGDDRSGGTERGRNKVFAAHKDALVEGLTPDSDEYFAHVNEFVRGRRPTKTTTTFVSKHGGAATVRLTVAQHKAATDVSLVWEHGPKKSEPLGVAEYARRLMIQKQQGLLDKLN
jgi:hypothetical protein